MDENLLEQLLNENESTSLDFKRDQYPFDGEDEITKSELLKDILAFANAGRRTDAFILIGVKEVEGGRSEVIGVSKHLADHSLQQFVNSKTNNPITFSYISMLFEGKQIGVIQIPLQPRPVYLKKDFGKLKKNIVYIRRGSSTDEALPDEIAKMGAASIEAAKQLSLELQFANIESREFLGNIIEIKSTILKFPPGFTVPDFSPQRSLDDYLTISRPNRNYFKELINYYQTKLVSNPIGFVLKNLGQNTAYNVCMELAIDQNPELLIFESTDFPERPRAYWDPGDWASVSTRNTDVSNVVLNKFGTKWCLSIEFGNIQPQAQSWADASVYVGSRISRKLDLDIKIYADDLTPPLNVPLQINFVMENKDSDLMYLIEIENERLKGELDDDNN